jgi:hypothetical protein
MLLRGIPFHLALLKIQGGPTGADREFCLRFGRRLAEQSDRREYRSEGEWRREGTDRRSYRYYWSTGELVAQMIRVVAILAFLPGGITLLGRHFEATVPGAQGTLRTPECSASPPRSGRRRN